MSATLNLVRWAGGKGKQLPYLLPLIPDGKIYVEPFGGGASVLLNRHRTKIEVYNDLDSSLVNLFSIVRDPETFDKFVQIIGWTPYSREGFENSLDHESETDAIWKAVKFYTVLNQSISGKRLAQRADWARARGDNVAARWVLRQEKLGAIHDRLRGVQIECRDALDILKEWDGEDTVFYCDPPYVLGTRKGKKYYAVEPGDEYHVELCDVLRNVKGSVVLSGYDHPIYNNLEEDGWIADSYKETAKMTVMKEGEVREARREVVWRNPRCVESGIQRPLSFDLLSREMMEGGVIDQGEEEMSEYPLEEVF